MPYEDVPYKAFACPSCGSEIKLNKQTFCGTCGVNLELYQRIERKTFYRKEFHRRPTDWEFCDKCGEPKVRREKKTWCEPKILDSAFGKFQPPGAYYENTQYIYTCGKCGYQRYSEIFRCPRQDEYHESGGT